MNRPPSHKNSSSIVKRCLDKVCTTDYVFIYEQLFSSRMENEEYYSQFLYAIVNRPSLSWGSEVYHEKKENFLEQQI